MQRRSPNTKDTRRQRRKYKKTNVYGIKDISNVPEIPPRPSQFDQPYYQRARTYGTVTPTYNYNNRRVVLQQPGHYPGLTFHSGPNAVYSPVHQSKSQNVSRGERISAPANYNYNHYDRVYGNAAGRNTFTTPKTRNKKQIDFPHAMYRSNTDVSRGDQVFRTPKVSQRFSPQYSPRGSMVTSPVSRKSRKSGKIVSPDEKPKQKPRNLETRQKVVLPDKKKLVQTVNKKIKQVSNFTSSEKLQRKAPARKTIKVTSNQAHQNYRRGSPSRQGLKVVAGDKIVIRSNHHRTVIERPVEAKPVQKRIERDSVFSQKKAPTKKKVEKKPQMRQAASNKTTESKPTQRVVKVVQKKPAPELIVSKPEVKNEPEQEETDQSQPIFNRVSIGLGVPDVDQANFGFDSLENFDQVPLESDFSFNNKSNDQLNKGNFSKKENESKIGVSSPKFPSLDTSQIIEVHHRSKRVDPNNPIQLESSIQIESSNTGLRLPRLESKIIEEAESLEESTTKNAIDSDIVPSFRNLPIGKKMVEKSPNSNVQIPEAYSPKSFNRMALKKQAEVKEEASLVESEESLKKKKKPKRELKKFSLSEAKFEEFEQYDSNKNISIQIVKRKVHPQIDQVIEMCGSPVLTSQNSVNSAGISDPNISIMSLKKEIMKSELKNFAKNQISISFPKGKDNEVDIVFGDGRNSIPVTVKGKKGESQDDLKKQVEILIQANNSRMDLNASRDLSRMLSNSSTGEKSLERKPSIFKVKSKSNVLSGLDEIQDDDEEATPVTLNVTPSIQEEDIGLSENSEDDDQIQLIGKNPPSLTIFLDRNVSNTPYTSRMDDTYLSLDTKNLSREDMRSAKGKKDILMRMSLVITLLLMLEIGKYFLWTLEDK